MKWIISKGNQEQPKRKVPYTAKQRIKDEMTEAQKEGINRWNLMVDILKENDLMEEK